MFKNEIEENLKVGLFDIIILKMISEEPLYGYQIRQEIASRSNELITIPEGSLYGPLYRMEKKDILVQIKKLLAKRDLEYTIT